MHVMILTYLDVHVLLDLCKVFSLANVPSPISVCCNKLDIKVMEMSHPFLPDVSRVYSHVLLPEVSHTFHKEMSYH